MPTPAWGGAGAQLGFTVTLPASWYELELHPARRDGAIRALVEERTRGNDTMWEQRRAIQRLLVEQATRAWESGAAYCAGFSIPLESGPITGSLTVSLGESPSDDQELLRQALATVPRGQDPLEPWAETTVVEIPSVGTCARSRGIEDTPFPGGGMLRNVFMVTVAPVPESHRAFLIAASSPVVALAEDLLDLFDAVSGTFRVVRLGEGADPREVAHGSSV